MAVTFSKQRKKQKFLVYFLIGIVLFAFLILWKGFLRKALTTEEPAPLIFKSEKIEIDFNIFNDERFKTLEKFEKTPSFEGETKRDDPFIAF